MERTNVEMFVLLLHGVAPEEIPDVSFGLNAVFQLQSSYFAKAFGVLALAGAVGPARRGEGQRHLRRA